MVEEIANKYLNIKEFGLNNISILIKNNNDIISYNVNDNTLYDIASITKLFSLKLFYELIKNNIISYDEVVYKDLTVLDIIKMRYHLEVEKKLKECSDINEIKEILKNVYIDKSIDAEYNDIGFIILQLYLEEKLKMSYDELMNKYVIKKLNLTHTMYKPKGYKLLGNGNSNGDAHDFKTRIMNNVTAAAGIFTNALDLLKIQEELEKGILFDNEFMKNIYDYTFKDNQNRNRSFSGIYKYTENSINNYVPNNFSKSALAHQGFTGSIVVFDYERKVHISILVDAIKNDSKTKSENYFEYFHKMKQEIFDCVK